jgi:L,D-transpeptidase catalytic domain
MLFRKFLLLFLWTTTSVFAQPSLTVPDESLQLVVVSNAQWDDTLGQMHRFERESPSHDWTKVGHTVVVNLGRTGLAWGESPLMKGLTFAPDALHKREGDGRSPAGVFPILRAFGHPAPPQGYQASNLPFLDITDEQCVDDKNSPFYNRVVKPSEVGGVSWKSAEQMKIGLYRLGLVVGHNCPKAKAGHGSCIFFHLQSGPGKPTAGCTSMDERSLTDLVLWLNGEKKPVVLQVPMTEYKHMTGLPEL